MEKSSLKYLLATFLISTSLCSFAADENSASDAGMPNNATLPSITPNETSPNPSFLPPSNETSPNPNFVLPSNETSANPKTDVVTPTSESEQESDNLNLEVGDNTADIANSHVANLENLSATQGETIMKLADTLSQETMDEIVQKTLALKKDSVPESARDFFNPENEKVAEFLRLNPALNKQIISMINNVYDKNWSTNRENSRDSNGRLGYIHTLVAEKLESSKAQILNNLVRFQELVKADTPYSTIESELGKDFITKVIALDGSENGALQKLYDSNTNGILPFSRTTVEPSSYTFKSEEKRQKAYVDASKAALAYLNTQGFVLPQSAVPAPTIAEQVSTMSTEQIAANLEQISAVSDANSASNSTEPAAGAASGEATPEQPATDNASASEGGANPNPTAPEIDLLADVSKYDLTKQLVEKLTPVQRAELASIKTAESLKDFLDKNKKLLNYLVNKTFDDLQNVRKQDLAKPGLYNMDLLHDQFLNNATVLTFFAEEAYNQAKESSKQDLRKKFLNKKETFKEFGDSFFPAKPAVSMADTEQGSEQLEINKNFSTEAVNILRSAVRFDHRLADVRKRFGRPSSTGGASGSGAVFGTSAADSALNK